MKNDEGRMKWRNGRIEEPIFDISQISKCKNEMKNGE
jgi:hypothetical protein